MASPIDTIIGFIELQDDQGDNWYAWASNQLSHAFLGVLFSGGVLVSGGAWYYALLLLAVLGITKKQSDWARAEITWPVVRDTIQDLLFFMIGGIFSLSISINSLILFAVASSVTWTLLVLGIVGRIVQSKRRLTNG